MALNKMVNQMLEDMELWQLLFGKASSHVPSEDGLFFSANFRQAWSDTARSGLIPGKAEFGQWSRHADHGDGCSTYSS